MAERELGVIGMHKDKVEQQKFDEAFYLASNPDVVTGVISGKFPSGKVHFEQKGEAEGRLGARGVQPRQRLDVENFSEEYYLAQFPDLALAVKDGKFPSGLSHYTQHGIAEGRYGRVPSGGHNNIAVVFMIYNRPEYTKLVFERIAAFKPKKLLIVADGPRNEEEVDLCQDARKIAENVDWDCEVFKNYSTKNLGCKRRVSSGLQWAFSLVEEAIIIEDDCVPDASFFYFCSAMLDFYRDDTQIMQISGSNFLSTPPTQYSYWFSRHSDIWGWATWRRAFRLYDPEMKVWPKFKKTSEVNKLGDSDFETRFWVQIFDKTHRGEIDTWDYQWHFTVYSHRGLCIVPRTNLITNIGHGPGATHTRDATAGVAGLACESVWQIYHPETVERSVDPDSVVFFVRYYITCQPALRYASVEHLSDIAAANFQTALPPATSQGRKMIYTFLRKLAFQRAVRFVCEPLIDYYIKMRLGADERMPSLGVQPATVSTVVVSHNEITARHGAGALLQRLLSAGKEDWINIYSRKHFPEEIREGQRQILISHADRRRASVIQRVLNALRDLQPQKILCEPFNEEDCLNAIAVHDLFDVPMCLYLMDDQNVIVNEISDKIMRELLEKSRIRFAISPEMRDAYEKKYGLKFWLLPPTAPDRYIEKTPREFSFSHKSKAALIGNIWSTEWLIRFTETVKETNITMDWYGNAGKPFARYDARDLASKNIIVKGFLEEDDLIETLRQYPFALVPTPSRELDIDHTWMSSLSFPSKLVTLISANLPILVIGEQNTPAANFVQRLGVGMVSPYSLDTFQQAVNEMQHPENQLRCRDACVKAAPLFSDSGLFHWIWASLEAAQPVDDRFERILCRDNNNFLIMER